MANDIRTCPNCNSPLNFQNGYWSCPICGSTFATDWQADDVERAREATRYQRAAAHTQRAQTVYQTRQAIQQAKQANDAKRSSQAALMRFAKPFIIMAFVGIILFIGRIVIFGAIGFTAMNTNMFGTNDKNSKNQQTASSTKVVLPVNELAKDPMLLKDVIASGRYYAEMETAQEIDVSGIAKKAGKPALTAIYSLQSKGDYGTFIMTVWKNIYRAEDGTTYDRYVSMKFYVESLDQDDHISAGLSPISIGRPYSWSDGGYSDLEELFTETITEAENTGDSVVEIPVTNELLSELTIERG